MSVPTVPVLVDIDGVINARWDAPADLNHWPDDSWRHERVRLTIGLEGTVTFSTSVIDGLRLIEAMPHTQMMWCTTWEHDAVRILAPLIGLGQHWPVLARIHGEEAWMGWWKATRARDLAHTHTRLVWIDDDATTFIQRETAAGFADAFDWINDHVLVVSPATTQGLTPSQLTTIERFLS